MRFDSTSFYFETPSWTLANLTQAPIRAAPAPDSKSKRGQEFLDRSAIYLIPQTLPKFHPDFDEAIRKILEADPTDSVVVIIFNKDKVIHSVSYMTPMRLPTFCSIRKNVAPTTISTNPADSADPASPTDPANPADLVISNAPNAPRSSGRIASWPV